MSVAAPLVAIVTPVYNGEAYLTETINSVQAQTYPNLVHVILDNASTDNTPKIIANAIGRQKEHDRVRILNFRNEELLPVAQNWEKAVRLSPTQSSYFRVLCADDLMPPEAISKMVEVAEANAAVGLVGCLIGMGGTPERPDRIEAQGLPKDRNIFRGPWTIKGYLTGFHGGLSPTHTLIRRRFLDEEKPFFTQALSMDTDACLRLMLRSDYGFVHEVIGWSREHPASLTSQLKTHNITIIEWLRWINTLGPKVMSAEELDVCRKVYLRHHFRHLLRTQVLGRDRESVEAHKAFLKENGGEPSFIDLADAMIEWTWLWLNGRRDRVGRAARLWPKIQRELNDWPKAS